MPTAERSIDIGVPPEALMALLCDFASYPAFVPDMLEATVLRSERDAWVVRFAIRIIRRVEYTLLLTRASPSCLTWSLVEGTFKANTGSWRLEALEGGRTRATYTLELDTGMFVPGSVLKTLLGTNLPTMLEAFKARAESG